MCSPPSRPLLRLAHLGLVALILSVAACGQRTTVPPSNDIATSAAIAAAAETPTASPSSPSPPAAIATPVTTRALHPLSVRAGVPSIDGLLDAVARGDRAALEERIQFSTVPCEGSPPPTPGGIPCPAGAAKGTSIAVFPTASGCDIVLAYDAASTPSGTVQFTTTRQSLAGTLMPGPRPLFVDFVQQAASGVNRWGARYAVVLREPFETGQITVWMNEGGRIISIWPPGCGESPPAPDADLLLKPR